MKLMGLIKKGKDVLLNKDLIIKKQSDLEYDIIGDDFASFAVAKDSLGDKSIVYSFGIGTNISFDLELIQRYSLRVYTFDPTPRSIQWIEKNNPVPDKLLFKPWGISNEDKIEKFYPPVEDSHVSYSIDNIQQSDGDFITAQVYRLATIMNKLNHTGIDLLKMDIEGKEYDVLDDIINTDIDIPQIVVEFHHRFGKIGADRTRKMIGKLNDKGYKIYYISERGEEFSFMKER